MAEFKVGNFVYVDQWQGSWNPDDRTTINCFGVVERVNSDNTYQVQPLYDNNYTTDVIDIVLYPCANHELTPAIEELDNRINKAQKLKNELMWKTLNQ